jgi:hypothetical protein
VPNITEYNSPVDTLRPTETGIDAVTQAARRAGAFFNQAGAATKEVGDEGSRQIQGAIDNAGKVAVDFEDHQQISHGAAAFAQFTEDQTKAWDNKIKGYTDADGVVHPPANPNDPALASSFMSGMEDNFNDLRKGFWTEKSQQWAEAHIEQLRNHFQTKTAADMGQLAADAVSVNYKQTANALSNTAMMSPDAVPDLIGQAKNGIAGIISSSPNLKGVAASSATTKLTEATIEQITKAGAIGAIRKSGDPEATANEWSQKYPQYINGAETKQLADQARMQIRLNKAEARANMAVAKQEKKDRADRSVDQLWSDSTRVDEHGVLVPVMPPDAKARINAAADAGASTGQIAAITTRLENIGTKQDADSLRNLETRSRTNQASLFNQTWQGQLDDPVAAYNKAYVNHEITDQARETLTKNFYADKSVTGQPLAQRRTEMLKAMEPTIDPARVDMNTRSSLGSEGLNRYEQWLREKETEAQKAGKNPQSIYDYDADGNSIAKQGARQFAVSATAAMRDVMEKRRAAAGIATQPASVQPGSLPPPAVGTVRGGKVFIGGDPTDATAWVKTK